MVRGWWTAGRQRRFGCRPDCKRQVRKQNPLLVARRLWPATPSFSRYRRRPNCLTPPRAKKPTCRCGQVAQEAWHSCWAFFCSWLWVVHRGMPRGSAQLPREALEVLGRAPFMARHNAYLVRCGSKLLLLNVSATSVETLTEITDPDEVDRLRAICRRGYSGATSTFRQALAGYSRHGEAPYVGNHDDQLDFGHLDEMDRRHGARM